MLTTAGPRYTIIIYFYFYFFLIFILFSSFSFFLSFYLSSLLSVSGVLLISYYILISVSQNLFIINIFPFSFRISSFQKWSFIDLLIISFNDLSSSTSFSNFTNLCLAVTTKRQKSMRIEIYKQIRIIQGRIRIKIRRKTVFFLFFNIISPFSKVYISFYHSLLDLAGILSLAWLTAASMNLMSLSCTRRLLG